MWVPHDLLDDLVAELRNNDSVLILFEIHSRRVPKKRSHLPQVREETGRQMVVSLTVTLVTRLVNRMQRILWRDHVSKAFSCLARASEP